MAKTCLGKDNLLCLAFEQAWHGQVLLDWNINCDCKMSILLLDGCPSLWCQTSKEEESLCDCDMAAIEGKQPDLVFRMNNPPSCLANPIIFYEEGSWIRHWLAMKMAQICPLAINLLIDIILKLNSKTNNIL